MLPATDLTDFHRRWRRCLMDVELARNYLQPSLLQGASTFMRNPAIDAIFSTQLYVAVVSILDSAIELHCRSMGIRPRSPKLYHRIEAVRGMVTDANGLHEIRKTRNRYGHDMGSFATWSDLDSAINGVERCLQDLQLVGARPSFKYYGERSAMRASDDQNIAFSCDFNVGVKEGDEWVVRFSWTQHIHNVGS